MSETQEAFRPGIYRHYKGGMYTALMLVKHHESRTPYVLYISHTYGGANVRPLFPVPCVDERKLAPTNGAARAPTGGVLSRKGAA
jgi:hypothetical protein